MMTTAETITIALSDLRGEIEPEMVNEARALDPSACASPVIVEQRNGRTYILDGYHRTAGMIRWCRDSETDLADVVVSVVVAHDGDLAAAAAGPGHRQEEAIAAIYAAAGVEVI